MGWMNTLCSTYESCIGMAGTELDDKNTLMPLAHSTNSAQIEITINMKGEFLYAQKVSKVDERTIIPVTENSCTRSSGSAPHPLCDKLCYIAGDYDQYTNRKKKRNNFDDYISQLEIWATQEDVHPKVWAVYQYLKEESVMKDLIGEQTIILDEQGYMSDDKIETTLQESAFVRFAVEDYANPHHVAPVWKDPELFRAYEQYYLNQKAEKEVCYVSGMREAVSGKHPAKIRNTGDKAKLISSNDKIGYTFRGRFSDSGEAVSIGYAASQKAHSALRWLIQRQGYRNGSAVIVSWAVNCSRVPDPMENTEQLFAAFSFNKVETTVDTAKGFADRLNLAMAGYKQDLGTNTPIVVMAVDTADGSAQGRLAIGYYSELKSSTFLEHIKRWHEECCWKLSYKTKEKGEYRFVGAPSPREIILSAYGVEQNGFLSVDDRLMKKGIERILPCIVEGRHIPSDIMHAMVRNSSRPMCMGEFEWKKVVGNTCAVIRKYKLQRQGVKSDMGVDINNDDRSYLFGRLLAVANKIEERTYDKGENRVTNAKRYWNVFTRRPAKTWAIIVGYMQPYLQKLSPWERHKYEVILDEITCKFCHGALSDDSLTEEYLLGYYCQHEALEQDYSKNMKTTEEQEDE